MMQSHQVRRQTGFTLIETVVTVGLLAVLAAFVIPTVIQKSGAADPVKVQNDLTSIRTGLETFSIDTKAGFPNGIWALTSRPGTVNHLVDSVTKLSASQVALWKGPYLAATIGAGATDSLATGYTAYIRNQIQRYDALHNAGEFTGGTGIFAVTATLFAAVRVNGLTVQQAATINTSIDGMNDLSVTAGANIGANVTGRFRFDVPINGLVTAYYLAVPIT